MTTGRATQLRDSIERLSDLHNTWAQTLPTAAASIESDHVMKEIDSTLSAIEVTQRALQPRLDTILALQSRIAREKARCDRIIAEIAEAQRKGVKGITSRDPPRLERWYAWSLRPKNAGVHRCPSKWRRSCWDDISQYVRDLSKGMPFQSACLEYWLLCSMPPSRVVGRWCKSGQGIAAFR